MWKWILAAAVIIVVLIAGAGYWAVSRVNTMASGGDTTSVTIAATPDRVFASLANIDSLSTWMPGDAVLQATHQGMIAVGDTLRMKANGTSNKSPRSLAQQVWVVGDVQPGKLLAVDMRNDSTGMVVSTRRDSLVAVGDSTRIITTLAAPVFDSIRSAGRDSSRFAAKAMNMSSRLAIAVFRMAADVDLRRLKARIEGKPLPEK